MKIMLLAGLIFALITLQSCKKKDNIITAKPEVKLLTRVIFSTQTGAAFKYYTYDEKHHPKTYKDGTALIAYTYYNDDLITIEISDPSLGTNSKYEFTYNSGKIIQAVGKRYNKTLVYGYIYNGNDLSQIHINENGIVVGKLSFTILNHNITKIVDESSEGVFITDYTYGSNKNMFFNARSNQINGIENLIGTETFDKYSVNEVLETKRTSPDGSFIKTMDSYVYDANGLPLTSSSALSLSTVGNIFVGKYTFEYEMAK